jgi:hypothetical protein
LAQVLLLAAVLVLLRWMRRRFYAGGVIGLADWPQLVLLGFVLGLGMLTKIYAYAALALFAAAVGLTVWLEPQVGVKRRAPTWRSFGRGVAAGLIANGSLSAREAGERCKLVHVRTLRWHDIGVIDAVLLLRDHIGNLLPYDPDRISALVLTRAEPAAVGMSPIGGYLDPVGLADDCGLALRCGAGRAVHAPISPGLFRTVRVASCERMAFGREFQFDGPGVVAFDGDRVHELDPDERAHVSRLAAERGIFKATLPGQPNPMAPAAPGPLTPAAPGPS